MDREMEISLENLVRVGTVTWTDPFKRVARVKFQDMDLPSAPLHVLANRPYIPGLRDKAPADGVRGGRQRRPGLCQPQA